MKDEGFAAAKLLVRIPLSCFFLSLRRIIAETQYLLARKGSCTMSPNSSEAISPSRRSDWLALVGFLALCFAVAGAGSVVTTPQIGSWYSTLTKPSWNPPSWIFGPVWTVLYCMMAVAAWLVWRKEPGGFSPPLRWFYLQLALNAVWSPLFFGLHRPGLALVDLVLLWGAIAVTTFIFWKRSTLAGALFVPYLAWVSFASTLNFAIWRLN